MKFLVVVTPPAICHFVELEKKMSPINIKYIAKGLEIYVFGIVKYYVRSKRGCMIVLWDQSYYVPVLPKYLYIILLKFIHISEGYKVTVITN